MYWLLRNLSRRKWNLITGVNGTGLKEVRACEIAEKTLAIVAKMLVIVGRIIATAEEIDKTAEKIIRIDGGVWVKTIGITKATEDTGATTEKIFRVPEEADTIPEKILEATGDTRAITRRVPGVIEEISKATGDYDVITKGISGHIVEFGETKSDIIRQGQIAGTDPLLNRTGINIPADHTEKEAGAKLTDVRLIIFNSFLYDEKIGARFFGMLFKFS